MLRMEWVAGMEGYMELPSYLTSYRSVFVLVTLYFRYKIFVAEYFQLVSLIKSTESEHI